VAVWCNRIKAMSLFKVKLIKVVMICGRNYCSMVRWMAVGDLHWPIDFYRGSAVVMVK
jgi:hypothetical protein